MLILEFTADGHNGAKFFTLYYYNLSSSVNIWCVVVYTKGSSCKFYYSETTCRNNDAWL